MKAFQTIGGLCFLSLLDPVDAAGQCIDWSAEVLSIEGQVEIQRSNQQTWSNAELGDEICLGDSVRTADFSRAALTLPDDTEIRLGDNAAVTLAPPEDENRTWLELFRGIIHVISRDPRALKITTPYVNAGLEGTEFLVGVDGDDFDLAVYEGEVVLDSPVGALTVSDEQRVSARSGVFGQLETNSDGRAALLWALHYPQILAGILADADAVPSNETDAAFYAGRAQSRLVVGSVAAARADVTAALAIEPDYPPALSIDAMIALSDGRFDFAQQQIQTALSRDPTSSPALIAQSYLYELNNELRNALNSIQRATDSEPDNAVAYARLAEIYLAVGGVEAAKRAGQTALSLDPNVALTHTVLGFAAISSGEFQSGRAYFAESIRLDSAAALPRVGLGIAMIRAGESIEGRGHLESALVFDVNDSVVRSYVGKAYFDEAREMLAGTQLDIAKSLDENDPTAWVYSAVVNQEENEPLAAFQDLNIAASLNNDQGVFRSRLSLDEDLATRSAGPGRIYRTLGFEHLAILNGSHSVLTDPSDYSGHRLLSDVYSDLPRHQVARIGENFQAQMLQPINVLPFAPELAQANISIMDSVGPAELAHAEARSSFVRNGIRFQASGTTGSNGSRGEHLVVSGLANKVSFNLGQFHYETDGLITNNDFEHDVVSAFIQARLSSDTSVQAEFRSARTVKGDLKVLFDPLNFDPIGRQREESESIRFGVTHRMTPWSTVIASVSVERSEQRLDKAPVFSGLIQGNGGSAEVQMLNEFSRWNLVSGLRVLRLNPDETTSFMIPLPVPPFSVEATNMESLHNRHIVSYLYANGKIAERLYLTVGSSVERLDGQTVNQSRTNPKIGLTWRPRADTYIRAAAFQTTLGPLDSKQVIRPSLEPTQVAGFGQYLFGAEGEVAKNYALGADHAVTPNLRIGAEHTERSLDLPFTFSVPPSPVRIISSFPVRESVDRAHLYWSPTQNLALKAGWQYEDFDFHGAVSPYGFSRLRTKRVPLMATMFLGPAMSVRFDGTHVRQEGRFSGAGPGPMPTSMNGQSQFWVFDASVDYRLPNRRGSIELTVKNLFDEQFRFQDTDPENPHVFPDRFLAVRFSLSY